MFKSKSIFKYITLTLTAMVLLTGCWNSDSGNEADSLPKWTSSISLTDLDNTGVTTPPAPADLKESLDNMGNPQEIPHVNIITFSFPEEFIYGLIFFVLNVVSTVFYDWIGPYTFFFGTFFILTIYHVIKSIFSGKVEHIFDPIFTSPLNNILTKTLVYVVLMFTFFLPVQVDMVKLDLDRGANSTITGQDKVGVQEDVVRNKLVVVPTTGVRESKIVTFDPNLGENGQTTLDSVYLKDPKTAFSNAGLLNKVNEVNPDLKLQNKVPLLLVAPLGFFQRMIYGVPFYEEVSGRPELLDGTLIELFSGLFKSSTPSEGFEGFMKMVVGKPSLIVDSYVDFLQVADAAASLKSGIYTIPNTFLKEILDNLPQVKKQDYPKTFIWEDYGQYDGLTTTISETLSNKNLWSYLGHINISDDTAFKTLSKYGLEEKKKIVDNRIKVFINAMGNSHHTSEKSPGDSAKVSFSNMQNPNLEKKAIKLLFLSFFGFTEELLNAAEGSIPLPGEEDSLAIPGSFFYYNPFKGSYSSIFKNLETLLFKSEPGVNTIVFNDKINLTDKEVEFLFSSLKKSFTKQMIEDSAGKVGFKTFFKENTKINEKDFLHLFTTGIYPILFKDNTPVGLMGQNEGGSDGDFSSVIDKADVLKSELFTNASANDPSTKKILTSLADRLDAFSVAIKHEYGRGVDNPATDELLEQIQSLRNFCNKTNTTINLTELLYLRSRLIAAIGKHNLTQKNIELYPIMETLLFEEWLQFLDLIHKDVSAEIKAMVPTKTSTPPTTEETPKLNMGDRYFDTIVELRKKYTSFTPGYVERLSALKSYNKVPGQEYALYSVTKYNYITSPEKVITVHDDYGMFGLSFASEKDVVMVQGAPMSKENFNHKREYLFNNVLGQLSGFKTKPDSLVNFSEKGLYYLVSSYDIKLKLIDPLFAKNFIEVNKTLGTINPNFIEKISQPYKILTVPPEDSITENKTFWLSNTPKKDGSEDPAVFEYDYNPPEPSTDGSVTSYKMTKFLKNITVQDPNLGLSDQKANSNLINKWIYALKTSIDVFKELKKFGKNYPLPETKNDAGGATDKAELLKLLNDAKGNDLPWDVTSKYFALILKNNNFTNSGTPLADGKTREFVNRIINTTVDLVLDGLDVSNARNIMYQEDLKSFVFNEAETAYQSIVGQVDNAGGKWYQYILFTLSIIFQAVFFLFIVIKILQVLFNIFKTIYKNTFLGMVSLFFFWLELVQSMINGNFSRDNLEKTFEDLVKLAVFQSAFVFLIVLTYLYKIFIDFIFENIILTDLLTINIPALGFLLAIALLAFLTLVYLKWINSVLETLAKTLIVEKTTAFLNSATNGVLGATGNVVDVSKLATTPTTKPVSLVSKWGAKKAKPHIKKINPFNKNGLS